jgi:hypothetical protein
MPKRKKETEEQREERFNKWKQSPEFQAMEVLNDALAKNPEANKAEVGREDICTDWTVVLHALWDLCKAYKIKMKQKARKYLLDSLTAFRVLLRAEYCEDYVLQGCQ